MSMKKQKNDDDAMIFNALNLNDHYEIWDVEHCIGKHCYNSHQKWLRIDADMG